MKKAADYNMYKIYVLKYRNVVYKLHSISDEKWGWVSLSDSNYYCEGDFKGQGTLIDMLDNFSLFDEVKVLNNVNELANFIINN